jgi:hypothetical protein
MHKNCGLTLLSGMFLLFLFPGVVFAQSCSPGYLSGDGNGDCTVDGIDYGIWYINYGTSGKSVSEGNYDEDADGIVDGLDYGVWFINYGKVVSPPTATATATKSPTTSPTMTPTPTGPTPTPPPLGGGMWISQEELDNLPEYGDAWDKINSVAYGNWGSPDLTNQDNKHDIKVLAGALVYAKTRDSSLRSKVRDGIIAAKRTLDQSSDWQTTNGVLSFGRQLGAYVISADLINLKDLDSSADQEFRNWLVTIRTADVGTHGRWTNLTQTCENTANNWGTFACPSRIAASIYLGDTQDVQRSANVIRAWLGDRSYYPENAPVPEPGYFQPTSSGDLSWACDEDSWVAVNPPCIKSGYDLNGGVVMDLNRGGSFPKWPPGSSGMSYSWEALQGVFVSVELLYRTGNYGNPYNWSDQALKRAMDFMQRAGWDVTNPGKYVPWMANARYGTNYPTTSVSDGRVMSWGDWLYQR